MANQERYLRPEVIQQVKRLDLRAKFIVQGFLSGLHSSPYHGFSVEFSEYRKYTPGDDISAIDWTVYAKTDRYYIKKFQAETNMTGYLVMDLSASMDYTLDQELTKFEYGICLAAALSYLMISQSDAVGLVTFDTKIRASLPPRSRRTQLSAILAQLSRLKPTGPTDIGASLSQLAGLVRNNSLVMVFSDLLGDVDELFAGLHRLHHRGNDIILFHILDQAEAEFPFSGLCEFQDNESTNKLVIDADGVRSTYMKALEQFRDDVKKPSHRLNVHYVPLHTGMNFDRALTEYLTDRTKRF